MLASVIIKWNKWSQENKSCTYAQNPTDNFSYEINFLAIEMLSQCSKSVREVSVVYLTLTASNSLTYFF